MNNKRIIVFNIFCSLLQQVVVTVSSFILPRFILTAFGSEINGLVSSLTQFLSYVSLLEGGITGVVSANLYKPLVDSDKYLLSRVIKTASNFYKKIGFIYIIYTVLLGIVYPLIVKTGFSFIYIFTLTIILSINLLVQYLFSITWKTLLIADKKGFVVSLTYIVVIIINTIITIVILNIYKNIHFVKFISALIYLIQPIVYGIYVSKHYIIVKDIEEDKQLMTQRWDGFAINIAAFVHNNTDIVILSLFASLSNVSVYSIYLLVISGLKSIINAVSQAITPVIGFAYVDGDKEKLTKSYTHMEFIILFITFFLFTVGGICITPFVKLYTKGIIDVNYNQPVFGWLLIIAELIYCIKDPALTLAYSANKFKDFKFIAYFEAAINIILSLILVRNYGLIGVAIGTIVAMSIRSLYQIIYLKYHILNLKIVILFKGIVSYSLGMILTVFLSNKLFMFEINSFNQWVLYGILNSLLAFSIFAIISIIIYYKTIKKLIRK